MNILHVIHYPVFGGPHNQALRLAGLLQRNGWRTTVLLPDEPGNAAERLRSAGLNVIRAPLGRLRATPHPWRQLSYALRLTSDVRTIRRVIREQSIDLVVLGGHVNVQGAIAARLERVSVVWQVLDTRTPPLVDEVLLHVSRHMADAVMTTGHKLAERHRARLGRSQRVIPFYPPVDCSEFRSRPDLRDEVRQEWGVYDEAPVFGAVSNINPQKGIDQLIRALAVIRKREPDARLVVIGAEHDTHKTYASTLSAEMAKHALVEGSDVIFAGARNDISRQLQGFDIFVMGSVPNSEGVPTAILEAMAAGLPVVATDVGGVSEVVAHGVTGFVVPPLQPRAIAQAALRILQAPDLRRQMSAETRAQALDRFDVEVCAQTHVGAFEAAVSHRKSHQTPLTNAHGKT